MPKITLVAEQTLVFVRQLEVSDEELAEIQGRMADGDQQALHLVAEDYLSEENINEDNGYEAGRLVLS